MEASPKYQDSSAYVYIRYEVAFADLKIQDTLLAAADPRALTHILVNNVQDFPAVDVSGTLE